MAGDHREMMIRAVPVGSRDETAAPDPLAACLVVVAKLLGRPATTDTLCAGLPLENGCLTPALFVRAADRAGLAARIESRKLEEISAPSLPAVLLLNDRHACVLVNRHDDRAEIVSPGVGVIVSAVPLATLARDYSGQAILLRRTLRFEAGTASERIAAKHHWFWGTMLRSWSIYGEVVAASVLINIFAVLAPLFFMNVYDRVVPNKAFETLWVLAIGMAIVYLFDFVLKALRGYFVDVAGKRADLALSASLYEHVMAMRLDARRAPVGTLASNLREFDSLRDFFTSATLASLIDLPFVLLFLTVLCMIGGIYVATVCLVAIPLVLAVGFALQAPLGNRIRRVFAASEAKHAALIETLGAIEAVKSLGAASHLQRKWEDLTEYVASESLVTRFLSALAVNFSALVQLSTAVGVLVTGVYIVAQNEMTLGGLIACVIISGRALAPFTQVASLLTRYHQAMSALEALNRIMDSPLERARGKSFVHRETLRGDIQFRDVVFRYPGQQLNALNGVSFSIKAGARVGVIGRIGSGKTTLAKLLLKLYDPASGSILVDGIDIRQIDPADLRRNVGYLPQNVVLFAGTARDNLVIGAPHVNDAAILRAARLAGLEEHVNRHPLGYDMPVGERGEELSGGQRQTVALARAMLLDPLILVLDEPTHAMDRSSEESLKARMVSELQGRTLILITHRESLLSIVDTLVVLDGGKVVAQGPKELVLRAITEGKVARAT
jgi:ATP-binding cassette subfamily C protein LapB